MSANPQTMDAYAKPITKGAEAGLTKGLAGSRQAQMTMPYLVVSSVRSGVLQRRLLTMKESTKNSVIPGR